MRAAVPLVLRSTVAGADDPPGLTLEYDISNPPPIPPGIQLDSRKRAVVEFSGAGTSTRCSLGVRVILNGDRCLLPLAVWTGNRHYLWHLREALRLPAFRGEVNASASEWSLNLSGQQAFRARPGPVESAAGQLKPDPPWLVYRYALAADWRMGPLSEGPVQLWSILSESSTSVTAMPAGACETAGDLGGWLTKLGASRLTAAKTVRIPTTVQERFEREVARAAFEPFAFRTYQGGLFGVPDETALAEAAALNAYRNRREIRLSGLVIVSVDCYASGEAIERLLPPPCIPSHEPKLRVMAVRGLADPSLDEAWLLADCSIGGRTRAWYAIAHVRGSLVGTEFGREVLGYPTKGGSAGAFLGGNRFAASVKRDGVLAFQAQGSYGGFSTGTTLAEMTVATLRLAPGSGSGPPTGEIVIQPWNYQGLRKPAHRASLDASFPANGRRDAWNSIGPVHAYAAMVMDSASLQRLPGNTVGTVSDAGPYYLDRCDGHLPWEWQPSDEKQSPSD